jgi:hypothetical protein
MSHEDDVRRALGPFIKDGTEAVQGIVEVVANFARPPDLRSAIRKILERHYRDCVPLDVIVDYLDLERIER